MDEIIIDIEPVFSTKRTVKLCRANADGTLTVIGSANVTITTDMTNNTQTATYKRKTYTVHGSIYITYIVIA